MPDDTQGAAQELTLPQRINAIAADLAALKGVVSDLVSKGTADVQAAESAGGNWFHERLAEVEAAVEHVVTNMKTTLGSPLVYVAPANRPVPEAAIEQPLLPNGGQ